MITHPALTLLRFEVSPQKYKWQLPLYKITILTGLSILSVQELQMCECHQVAYQLLIELHD